MVEELSFEQQDVNRCCRVLEVSRSGYYDWLKRPISARKTQNQELAKKIKQHWIESRETYGLPRLFQKLKNENINVGKNRVHKIMKENNIFGIAKKKFKVVTTDSNHNLPIAHRVFKTEKHDQIVTGMNKFWGGDITYIPTEEGWLYLSIFLDLFTRKVVGHAMDKTMTTELVIESLNMGLKRQGLATASDLTAHSDRGSQYASEDFRLKLAAHKITASMSRKGNCYDNAFVETFFKTLKTELIYRNKFKTRSEAKAAIFEFIEVWYNRQRLHSSLGYLTPEDYEAKQYLTAA
jgi:transposase InsO family protein